jgi:putative transposase
LSRQLAERSIAVSYETIRRWCRTFGQAFADGLRRRRPRPGDKWHLDQVQLKFNGRKHWLWRAVDQEGIVLDILVQPRRNQEAAEAFLRRLVTWCGYETRVVITDKLASYPPAMRRVLPLAEHRRHKRLNNRAENSHRATRRRD